MTGVLKNDPWDSFSLEDPALSADFDGAVAQLIEGCPVAHNQRYDYWMLSRYADVRSSALDWQGFSSAEGILPVRTPGQRTLVPIELDPPVHTRWRRALLPHFSAKAVSRYADGIAAVAHHLIDQLPEGEVDLAEAFCNPLPGIVLFQEVLGTPIADTPYLMQLIHTANFGYAEQRIAAWESVADYVDAQLRDRRDGNQRDDLLQAVLDLDFDDAPCTWEDKKSVVSLLISGGLDTTAHVLAGACLHLAQNPERQSALRANPSLIDTAVEEYLRYFASAFAIGRTTTRETEIDGRAIPAGARVMMGYGAACRDPQVFDRPNDVDLTRSPNRHLAFGAGPHACIGTHLARLELRGALSALLFRVEDLALDTTSDTQFRTGMMRIALHLPVTYRRTPTDGGSR